MEKYDVIIVGAGTAGLFCANYLARYGKKTLLLEHNHQVGGLTGGFWRKKYYFDAGDQSFESAGIMFPLLKTLGLYNPDDWEPADYATAYEHGTVIMGDQQKALVEFADLFPDLREGLTNLFSEMIRYSNILGEMSNDSVSPIGKTGLARLKAIASIGKTFLNNRKELKDMMSMTVPELYHHHLPPSEYRDKMTKVGYRNIPVALGTGFWYTFFEDYWHYKRGLQGFMDDLEKSFVSHGGTVICNQTIEEILIDNNIAKGVRTTDNNYYRSQTVVFAGALKKLITDLIDPSYLDASLIQEIETAPVSEPLVALYLGLDMSHKELAKHLKTHHTLFFPEGPAADYDAVKNKKMHDSSFTEITWTSMRSPNLAPKGKNSLVLQNFTSYNWLNNWGTKGNDLARPKPYKDLKKMVSDQMIDTAARYIPGLKDRIDYQTLGTPLSTIRYTLNPEGASCGWSLELEKSYLKDKWLSLTTPVAQLYSIGHYTFWPGGVPMAALSGLFVAQMIKHNIKVETLRSGWDLLQKKLI